ncbi:tc3a_0 protein [Trichonephila clavipes]|nr:tc3a_0 protein [Trichonephila clavipes]
MATNLTAVKSFILSLVWQFNMNRLTPEQRFQIVQFYFENNGRDFHKRILFSDEAHFWLNGYVNKQNCRIGSEANPQVYVETPLHPEKLTVWCALWAGEILLQKR